MAGRRREKGKGDKIKREHGNDRKEVGERRKVGWRGGIAGERQFVGICKVGGASSLSAPLDKHRFAYDRHFAGSII